MRNDHIIVLSKDSDKQKCLRCGEDALDTGWECTECGYDNMPWYCTKAENSAKSRQDEGDR